MTELKEVLMRRDELTSEEADDIIEEMKERIYDEEDPDEILYDYGLEPDYFFDLI